MKRPEALIDYRGSSETARQILEEHSAARAGALYEEIYLEEIVLSQTTKEHTMFTLEAEAELALEYADRAFETEQELNDFLAGLPAEQLAEAAVICDDETFVVFYPQPAVAPRRHDYHFDLDGPRPAPAPETLVPDRPCLSLELELAL